MSFLDLYIEAKEGRQEKAESRPLAGYSFKKSQEYYSGLFGESFSIKGDMIVFGNGITYSKEELDILRDMENKTKKTMHDFKKVFGGTLQKGDS